MSGSMPSVAEALRRIKPIPSDLAPVAINAHIHIPPNFSAFQSPEEAIAAARAESIRLLGLSNYYDFGVYTRFAKMAGAEGLHTLFGLEIMARDEPMAQRGERVNDPANPGKMYLCGKGMARRDNPTDRASAILATIRSNDQARMQAMIEALNGCLQGAGMDARLEMAAIVEDVARIAGVRTSSVYLQERHVARAVQQAVDGIAGPDDRHRLYARLLGINESQVPSGPAQTQEAIRTHLMKVGRPAFVPESYVAIEEARALVLGLGGIPCYPVLADGVKPLTEFEATPDRLIGNMAANRLYAAEFIPLRNDPEILAEYVPALRAAGIPVSAGTEHNSPASAPLGPTCRGGVPIPPAIETIFHEGACVALAHQHLLAYCGEGFVDEDGNLCEGFADNDERIRCFAALGHQLLMEGPPAGR